MALTGYQTHYFRFTKLCALTLKQWLLLANLSDVEEPINKQQIVFSKNINQTATFTAIRGILNFIHGTKYRV